MNYMSKTFIARIRTGNLSGSDGFTLSQCVQ
jgi:hypothetical protein